jgi:UDP-glucose 4-epimerase
MTNILITGGAGFIGSSLAVRLLENEAYHLVLVDNLLTGSMSKLPRHPRCQFIRCDVNQYDEIAAVMSGFHFTYVFHYAAVVGVNRTLANPLLVMSDLDGIKNILRLSKSTGVQKIFFSSSSEVYGEPVEYPQHEETTPLNSRLPYAVVKNASEAFLRSYYKEYGLPFTIFRFFNTYGPRQSTDFVISKFLKAAGSNEPITIYGNGSQSRTFCYIDDNTECVYRVLEMGSHNNDVLNIGSDQDCSVLELARLVIRITGSTSQIQFLPPLPEGDMTRRKPDISKMRAILKRELVSLESGLQRILESGVSLTN